MSCWSGSGLVACAARPPSGRGRPAAAGAGYHPRATRSSARWRRPGRERPGSPPATGWAPPGWPGPTAPAGTAGTAGRTCARPRSTPAGTSTAATPSTSRSPTRTRTRCRRGSPTPNSAPLLRAGILGYRALLRAEIPPGGLLGIWGFGGSAHLAAQVALAQGAAVHVFTRAPDARELALSLGAASAQDSYDPAPEPLDSASIFAPVGGMVPPAAANQGHDHRVLLRPGRPGTGGPCRRPGAWRRRSVAMRDVIAMRRPAFL